MRRMHRTLSPFPVFLVALLLLLPAAVQAAPSLRVTVIPPNQTVKAGQPAIFTVAVKNTGDTFLSPVMITDGPVPECNRNFTGLLPGRVRVFTCSHRGERRSYGNAVRATGSSAANGIAVSDSASASVVVEPWRVADLIGPSPLSGGWLRIPYLNGFFPRFGAGGFRNTGVMTGSLGMQPATPYLDTGTATALQTISRASETPAGGGGDLLTGREEPAGTMDLAITPIFRTDVFTRGEEGYHFFMAPVLKFTPDGSLILFADAWKYNATDPAFLTPTTILVYKRSTDLGVTWSPLEVLDDPGELWCAFNSAGMVDWISGKLWVFYLLYHPGHNSITSRPGTNDTQILARWSADSGLTWSGPIDLTPVARDMTDPFWNSSIPGPAGAIQTSKGRLLVPFYRDPCTREPFRNFAIFSDDHGDTWQRGQFVPDNPGMNENQLVELPDGRILMEIRQNDGPHRWLSESNDGGETWSTPWPGINEITVNCALEEYLYLSDDWGRRDCLLWTGPRGLPGIKYLNPRWFLTLRVSYDGDRTFPIEYQLSNQTASYSDLAILGDNTVGVAWEEGEQSPDENITFARFSIHPGPRHE